MPPERDPSATTRRQDVSRSTDQSCGKDVYYLVHLPANRELEIYEEMLSQVKGRCPSLRAFGGPSFGRSKQFRLAFNRWQGRRSRHRYIRFRAVFFERIAVKR